MISGGFGEDFRGAVLVSGLVGGGFGEDFRGAVLVSDFSERFWWAAVLGAILGERF